MEFGDTVANTISKSDSFKNRPRSGTNYKDYEDETIGWAVKNLRQHMSKLTQCIGNPDEKKKAMNEADQYRVLFERFLREKREIDWQKVKNVPDEVLLPYSKLQAIDNDDKSAKDLLDKLIVVKLNGGLGTSMGCKGPKSLISVRSGMNFLDLTVQQIESLNKKFNTSVPLVLMNSFNTDEDTAQILKKYETSSVRIKCFNQHRFPRINKETLLPLPNNWSGNKSGWYPPGHGDIYKAIYDSGLLEEFIQEGKEVMFVSNIDNLGATVDFSILNHISTNNNEMVLEVTDKTRADVKGGTLIEYENRLRLLEVAQVPKDYIEEFKSVSKFKIFNTNNLWLKLHAVKRICLEDAFDLEIIVNNKRIEVDGGSTNVIQLETAIGAAVKCFENSIGIIVNRSRFLPVKKTSDLLLVMSNLYDMSKGSLSMSNKRMFKTTPLIKLGDEHFKKVHAFSNRFPAIPDMLELDHLTVSGDVTFGKDVTLKGTVIIIANHGDRIDIPTGSVLENKIVSGNLRILDH
jgi:UTP--glucose-1-phosphate uridylyltransferase